MGPGCRGVFVLRCRKFDHTLEYSFGAEPRQIYRRLIKRPDFRNVRMMLTGVWRTPAITII